MRLTSLDLSGSRPYLPQEIITWLISNAPNLKNIALNESYLQLDVANAMINSTHLAKLEINQARRNDDFEGIIRFLNHHIEMGDTSTLEEITITTRKMTSDATWLSLISKLQCLKNLNLRTYCIPADCLPAMEEIGQGCPALEELTLGKYNCDIGDGIIGSFCQHSNIKCLKIGSRSLSSVSLMLLTSTFSSLEQLYVRCNLPESVMMMLKNKHVSKIVINTLPTATY
ncbi:hypothetical protein O0I10_013341 [Lichtheimia ornata]|uniref:Uncharacterized protein n=1 Tax=Lichtheimia ornata TaxID=688661 RepID=A0AAD7UQD5_9FUNG|nr:uncharacterized protein O0I10_013341 [Lichtheimia ornata]KAJ8651205.1 hypothetical protein O0I10_013341 [Lichtheimia ornata]